MPTNFLADRFFTSKMLKGASRDVPCKIPAVCAKQGAFAACTFPSVCILAAFRAEGEIPIWKDAICSLENGAAGQ